MNDSEIAELIAQLAHDDKPTLRAAVDALIPLAAEISLVRETLLRRLLEAERTEKWPIAYILAHLPQPAQPAIQNLLDELDHRDPDIRWAIALLLVRIAKDDRRLVNLLSELCSAGTANQKRMAIYCLRNLMLIDSASLVVLLAALNDSDASVRVAAVIALKQRTDVDAKAKDRLLEVYLKDNDARVRNAAVITLASLGAPSEGFLTAVKQNSASNDAQTRKAANAALELLKKRRSASIGSQSSR